MAEDGVHAQQSLPDTAFRHVNEQPTWPAGSGPRVLIDEAHHNDVVGFRIPFGRLLEGDGYRVEFLTTRLHADALQEADVLVIANALAAPTQEASDTLGSAFTPGEVEAVLDWVRAGGGLLLFVDHRPFPRSAVELGRALGVEMIDGYALDYEVWDPLVFRREDGTLRSHAITDGSAAAERVDSVATFFGHAMRAIDPAVVPLMIFGRGVESMHPEDLWGINDATPRVPVQGLLQGAARDLGRGRVVIFGETGMAVARRAGPRAAPVGMNAPVAVQNARMLLNAARWVARPETGRP